MAGIPQLPAVLAGLPSGRFVAAGGRGDRNVEIPPAYEGRGWFWRYCQFCLALTSDGPVVEEVQSPHLCAAIKRKPEFVEVSEGTFVIRKKKPGDWPRKLTDSADKR